jgi:valine--pyruvate aminotransferase
MTWELSQFGEALGRGSGIGELMQDLGEAIANGGPDVCMLGGGQPAHIPAIDAVWRRRMQQLMQTDGQLEHALGNYEPPAGNPAFRTAVAEMLHRDLGWNISRDNVAITAGGQTAFFLLFNALAGRMPDSRQKKVLVPLVPEYIGYANQSTTGSLFQAGKPKIQRIGDHGFKYHVDFESLAVGDDIAAICVSRPTNPSGNVLTDDEISKLSALARSKNIPLIIDNAYGNPFPGAIFTKATPVWNDGIILTLSLSKIGLPGTRTGIVVARPEIIDMVASMVSIVGLANTNIGQSITLPLIQSGEILELSRNVVRPFYEKKSLDAQNWVQEYFSDSIPYRIHRSEGAFFLWMWFEGLPITAAELYRRLKARNVFIIPGHYFFFGVDDTQWKHRTECIRMTFTMPEQVVRRGLKIIAEEVSRAYGE